MQKGTVRQPDDRRSKGRAGEGRVGERLRGVPPVRRGFTLLELMIVMSVLLVAFLAMSQTLVTSIKLTSVNRESALAADGIRERVEILQGVEEFSELFALYNANPDDDPGGVPGSAPGSGFAVDGLRLVEGDPDGFVGEIVFPTIGFELREDAENTDLGMPRDLDGDGGLDREDHAGDYRLLPVLLRLHWSQGGLERTMEVRTLIADR